MMFGSTWSLVLLSLVGLHVVVPEEVSKATLLDSLPDGGQLQGPTVVTVRTSFMGAVEFVDSSDFAILVNASAPSMEELAGVQYSYNYMDGELLLQVHQNLLPEDNSSIIVIIIIVICVVCLMVFLGMLGYVAYWLKYERTNYIKKLPPTPKITISQISHPHLASNGPSQHSKLKETNRDAYDQSDLDLDVSHELERLQLQKIVLEQRLKKMKKIEQIADLRQQISSINHDLNEGGVKNTQIGRPHIEGGLEQRRGHLELARLADEQLKAVYTQKYKQAKQARLVRKLSQEAPAVFENVEEEDFELTEEEEEDEEDEEVDGETQVPLVVRARKNKSENPNRIEVVVSLNSTPTKKRRPRSRPSKSSGDDAASSDGEATSSTRSTHSVKRLHLTTLAVISVLGLVTGVCCNKFQDETRVQIKIYMPAHFISKGSAVYAKIENRVELVNGMDHTEINIYDVDDPYLSDISSSRCHGIRCADKCDVKTGSCICRRGFRPMENGICTDISECIELGQLCHQDAVCRNTNGGYKCICLEGFHGDGLSCTPCLQQCPSGHFKHSACSPTQDMVCQSCLPKCKDDEYEFVPCTNLTDRVCKPKDALIPQLSPDTVYEDKNRNFGVRSRLWYLEEGQFSGAKTYALSRGTDLSIQISVNEVNLLPQFRAVRHDRNNENDAFYGDSSILTQYCPHPMPQEYDLQFVMHKGAVVKATYRNCTLAPSGGMVCKGGYHMDPRQPCLTYKKFGSPPRLHPTSVGVLLCTEPSQLTDLYGMSEELTEAETVFADPTERCATQRASCQSCINKCAEDLKMKAPEKCRITGEDPDDGWSPRLRHCQNCCLKENCAQTCSSHSDSDCQPVKCLKGNVAELVLSPTFSSRAEDFLCHIEPAPDYLYDIQYSVVQGGKVLLDRVFRAKKRINTEGDLWNTVDVHPLLNVHYSTGFAVQPQVLHGNSRQGLFTVSKYQPEGRPLHGPLTSTQRLRVRPKFPWGISTKTWSQKSCDMTALDDFIPGEPITYRPLSDISASFIEGQRYRYRLHNTTAQPYIFFELPQNTSVMALFFPRVEIMDDTSLRARLDRNATHWLIHAEGRMKRAPGFFTIKVHEDDYPDAPLFNMDIGQTDHEAFKVLLPVATGSSALMSKSVTVEISGINNKVAFRLHWAGVHPVQAQIQALKTKPMIEAENAKDGATAELSKSLVIGLGAVIGFLLLLLVLGSCLSDGKGIDVDSRFHTSHLMMTVMYVVFRTAYSLAVTCTVFLFVWIYLNSGPLHTLRQYPSFLVTVQSLQQLEAQEVNQYLIKELDKQMVSFNQTRTKCQAHIQAMQDKMIKAQEQLNAQQLQQLTSQRVSQAMYQYAHKAMEEFTATVTRSRAAYNSYVSNTVSRLLFDMKKTEENLLSIEWLTGASKIYDAVKEKRTLNGVTTRTFSDWLGFKERLQMLEANLTLPEMPLPNLQDFRAPIIDATTVQSSIANIQEVTVPKNIWFVHSPNVTTNSKKNSTTQEQRWKLESQGEIINWTTFLVLVLIIDCVWLIHRVARTYVTAHRLMYGTPHYIDCTEHEDEVSKPSCCGAAMEYNIRLMKTEFVPKLVGVGLVCALIYFLLASSQVLITASTLSSLGYFKALTLPISSVRATAMTQLRAQAHRLNTVELPSYEKITSAHIEQYQIILQLMEGMACQQGADHLKDYCIGGQRSGVAGQGSMDLGSCQTASYQTGAAFIPCDIGLVNVEMGKR
ncbi:uncharacterized protein LOC106160591 isoform X3 [Lingula anatina]|uniref:Uncharacterized protein LOC106160591 isoform X3 n=1 Tax=Lingula anatina TaxID=7574 RepID=A0A2R2ML38_LINAN|nr:uncharacterized protein LOC106160591 isoform X3 [Lingula anatina]|eukprot:XP_023930919.1 uncharacterized protein LOC106160591 isoform X3 [Lingula anatina]